MIAITGASGFIGREVSKLLPRVRGVSTRGTIGSRAFDGCDAIVNLAGESVAQRWTKSARGRIVSSRVDGTRKIVDALAHMTQRPRVLISGSAMGIYGGGFLQEVCEAWEREAIRAEQFGVRVVLLRITTALGDGGALQKMLLPFRLGIGGTIGDGKQRMSWIHVRDCARLIQFAIENDSIRGPIDAAAPNPVTNAEFTRELGRTLHRPTVLMTPKFMLDLVYGKMARIIYDDLAITPDAALAAGFKFQFPTIREALENILAV
jgi:uncharacterized protein (TIGR01777 family)